MAVEKAIVEFIYLHKEELTTRWLEKIRIVQGEQGLMAVSDELFETTNEQFVELIITILLQQRTQDEGQLSEYTERFIQAGWPLVFFTRGLQLFRSIMFEVMSKEDETVPLLIERLQEVEKRIDELTNSLVYEYSGSWESRFEMQKLSLMELSAPFIPVFEGICVMPLIGTIDTSRAKLIMENLLDGVIKHRSEVVLIDITGVPIVDTMVANHIIQAAEAVRLVGAECILVGIRPEIAQTIVNLGIDLSKFQTKSSLKKGIEKALEVTNKKVIEVKNGG